MKNGGICLILSTRKGVMIPSDIVSEESELEKEIWDRVDERFRTLRNGISIGEYAKTSRSIRLLWKKPDFAMFEPRLYHAKSDSRRQPISAGAVAHNDRIRQAVRT